MLVGTNYHKKGAVVAPSPKETENMNQSGASQRIETILKTQRPKRFGNVDIRGVEKSIRFSVEDSIKTLQTEKQTGLVISGGVGTGKSSILYILRDAYAVKNFSKLDDAGTMGYDEIRLACKFFPIIGHFELIAELRQAVQGGEPSKFRDKGFLAIDDLGRGYEDESGWNLALLEEFVDYRWSNNLLTAVSTNFTIPELRGYKGWGRIVDRLLDPSWNVLISLGKGSRRRTEAPPKKVRKTT